MPGLSLLFGFACAVAAFAGGIEPRPKPSDYPHHLPLADGGAIGFEYHGRGVPAAPGGGSPVFLGEHIVLEVAYFPPKDVKNTLRGGNFLFRIDKMKHGFAPEPPSMVAASLKYSEWGPRRGLEVQAGPVIIGPPGTGQSRRFPGDQTRPPSRGPTTTTTRSDDKPDPQDLEAAAVIEAAFPEGETGQAVAGYFYYRWGGNLKKMKRLVLEFTGPGGPATFEIPLR